MSRITNLVASAYWQAIAFLAAVAAYFLGRLSAENDEINNS